MSDCKILKYHKPNWDGLDLFPEADPIRLLWPTNVFSVLVARYPKRQLNFFEICVLRLLRLASCNIEILCERTCLREGFVRLILRRIRDQGYVKGFHLTKLGMDLLNSTMAAEPEIDNVFVFRDCLSKKFYPIIVPKLEFLPSGYILKGKNRARVAYQECRCPSPTQADVMDIIHEFNALCAMQALDSQSVYRESIENIEVSKEKPDLVWLCSEARLGRINRQIYVSDPFLGFDSAILGENMQSSELEHIATELTQRYVTYRDNPDDNKIERFESWNSRLKPLSNTERGKLQTILSDSDCTRCLSNYYYVLEQAFKTMLSEYDYTELVNSLRNFDENIIQDMLICLANEIAVNHQCDNGNTHSAAPSTVQADRADVIECDASPDLKPWLKQKFTLKGFLRFSGSRLQECLTGEANLRFWIGLALLVNKKRPLPAFQKLFQTDFLPFINYLTDFRNKEYHGESPEQRPTLDQLEECRKTTLDIVRKLVPSLDISSQAYNEMSDLDGKIEIERYYMAESELIKLIGYAKMRKLPRDLREKLILIKFHTIGKHKSDIFSNILAIERLIFKILHAENSPDFPGNEVLQKAQSNFPQLPEIFWKINPRKLAGTIAGIPQSLRASLVCLMAFSEKHKNFFNAERLRYLEQILRLRTHNWQKNVQSQPFPEIKKLGEQTISFATAIIEEYKYEKQ